MYDLTILGAGWAGFNAAIKAKEAGLKTCLIESHKLGGTCLNYGCIPTKALLASAKIYSLAVKSADFGVNLVKPALDFKKIQERKDQVVKELALGMQASLKGIDFLNSSAKIISANKIHTAQEKFETKYILVATGSHPVELPGLKFDGKKVISSEDALALNTVPESLLIVGGGFIGCEFGFLFNVLGSKVTIIEKTPYLLPCEDKDIGRKMEIILKKKGINVLTQSDITSFDPDNYEKILVCVGRASSSTGLGLEELGMKIEKNRIMTDDYLRTNLGNIYAAGDCTGKVMLAHYAAYQGRMAVENMVSGNKSKANNQLVPSAIFTEPQAASVGLSQEKAECAGIDFKALKFDFRANGMARIMGETDGFIKVLIDQNSKELLGACIIGPLASELISTFTLAISKRMTADEIRRIIFAHPSLSESIREVF